MRVERASQGFRGQTYDVIGTANSTYSWSVLGCCLLSALLMIACFRYSDVDASITGLLTVNPEDGKVGAQR